MELHLILMGKEEVTELYPVPDSHIPVMKFKFNRISIDLVYARLSLSSAGLLEFAFVNFCYCMC